MLSTTTLQARISGGKQYHLTVERFMRELHFLELHAKWGDLSVIEMHAAVNPHMYKEFFSQEQVLGLRTYSPDVTRTFTKCMSEFFWGYPCCFTDRPLQADHSFPYALGGATDPTNLLVLCDLHNQAKGHDIHLYPCWETAPAWLKSTADRIARAMTQYQRLTCPHE